MLYCISPKETSSKNIEKKTEKEYVAFSNKNFIC